MITASGRPVQAGQLVMLLLQRIAQPGQDLAFEPPVRDRFLELPGDDLTHRQPRAIRLAQRTRAAQDDDPVLARAAMARTSVGSAGNRCIQPRQAAEPSSRTTSETRHATQTANPRRIAGRTLACPARRDRAGQPDHQRRPDHAESTSVQYPNSTPRSADLDDPPADAARQDGNPAGQHDCERSPEWRSGTAMAAEPHRRGEPRRSRPRGTGSASAVVVQGCGFSGHRFRSARRLRRRPRTRIPGREAAAAGRGSAARSSASTHRFRTRRITTITRFLAVDDPVFLGAERRYSSGFSS